MKKRNLLLAALPLLSLVACTTGKDPVINDEPYASAKISISGAESSNNIIEPKDVTITETYHSIQDKRQYNTRVMPSTGTVNILVLPILIPGYEEIDYDHNRVVDNEQILKDLNEVFFGQGNEKSESVASFYKKSSYGKLNIKGTVLDEWFDVASETKLRYESATDIDIYDVQDVIDEALKYCEDTLDMDLTEFDNDEDGYIDGVWCIYSCPDYTNGGPRTDYENYWAYTSWGNQVDGNPNVMHPIYNLYGWASYDFMYTTYGMKTLDARTYIHETGHFLGLNDYYADASWYNPVGKSDMMDGNIMDLNSYSKMLLGWTKPYLALGNGEIDLNDMSVKDNLIVIPGDSFTSNDGEFDPFSEYVLIELYTPNGLNYYDSHTKYPDRPLGVTKNGIKIYHVDNRKFVSNISDPYNISMKEYDPAVDVIDDNHRILLPITNKIDPDIFTIQWGLDVSYDLYDEIRLIEATNWDTFTTGGYQKDYTLFHEGDVFSISSYGNSFFPNRNKLNNHDSFSKVVTIGEIKEVR
ncbi:MAG: hypothetical protein MJ238_01480 [Bacilli bacterium]|nr:hypothetical protein [Bacilli bacterium]